MVIGFVFSCFKKGNTSIMTNFVPCKDNLFNPAFMITETEGKIFDVFKSKQSDKSIAKLTY